MKNNKLTLKSLKQELELIKGSKTKSPKITPSTGVETKNSHNAEVAGHDIKGSYINRIYMKSSMLWLYIITIVLSYGHKIPYIGRIITILSLWYGKTTWWKILVKIRKIFIVFNAIIGVFVVFKSTGFTPDLLLHNIIMMGHTYVEIFTNFSKRLFYWFIELFDHKIVPNVPNNPPSNNWFQGKTNTGSGNKPIFVPSGIELPNILDSKPFSLRALYKDGVINTPSNSWYSDWSTLLWWSATLVGIAGAAYLGYKIIVDPSIITNLWNTNNGPTSPINPTSPTDPGSSASTITPASMIPPIDKGIISSILSFTNKLNPLNWFTSVSETNTAREIFMERQNQINLSDMRYYPFTEVNPYDSWFDKIRIKWLGENTYELANRLRDKAAAMREANLPKLAESVQSSPLPGINELGPLSGFNTPKLGLGLKFTSSTGLLETIEASSSWNKLSSLANTPSHVPISLPIPEMSMESISSVIPSWNDHVINQAELNRYVDAKKGYTYAKAVSSFK
jgi:hypothetical protein